MKATLKLSRKLNFKHRRSGTTTTTYKIFKKLKGGPFRDIKKYIRENVKSKKKGILSQSHSAKKLERGDPFFETSIWCKISKNMKRGPFGDKKKFRKVAMPKKLKGGPYSLVRFCILR